MISPEAKKILEGVNATPFGRALQEFLDDEYKTLDSVRDCVSLDDVKGRQHAIKILDKLFGHLRIKRSDTQVKNSYE